MGERPVWADAYSVWLKLNKTYIFVHGQINGLYKDKKKVPKPRIKTVSLVAVLISVLEVTAKILSAMVTVRCLPLVNSSEPYYYWDAEHTHTSEASSNCGRGTPNIPCLGRIETCKDGPWAIIVRRRARWKGEKKTY